MQNREVRITMKKQTIILLLMDDNEEVTGRNVKVVEDLETVERELKFLVKACLHQIKRSRDGLDKKRSG
ncbi:MAG TPA: hypothetical protein ENH41_03520 [Candidatus Omnitrophica bacterium]|nr:hypothetical protein [Candidatus Omnitrophota bacterium]